MLKKVAFDDDHHINEVENRINLKEIFLNIEDEYVDE